MIIPGFIISAATFPGVIVHELGHKLMCNITKTRVLEICYFRLGTPAGYVVHEAPSSVWKHLLIGTGPFFVNTLIGFFLGLLMPKNTLPKGNLLYVDIALMWLAVSIAMHSFPSTGDAIAIWKTIWTKGSPVLSRVIGTPLVMIICLGAAGSFFWLDLVYGAVIVFELPRLLLG